MKALNTFVAVVAAFLAVTGGMIQDTEIIPKNAQIDVFPKQKIWLPHYKSVKQYFDIENPELEKEDILFKLDMLSNLTSAQYADVYKGKYQGFELPKDFGKKSDYTIGYDQSILWSWIFGKKRRWNEDGSWNY
jgi:hypothetical protein